MAGPWNLWVWIFVFSDSRLMDSFGGSADQKINGAPRGRHKPDYRLCSKAATNPLLGLDLDLDCHRAGKAERRYRSSGFYEEDIDTREREIAMMRMTPADFYVRRPRVHMM